MSRARKTRPLPVNPEYAGRLRYEHVYTAPVLHELRISTLNGTPVDPDRFIHVIEILEETLRMADKCQTTPARGLKNTNMAAEEIAEVIQTISLSHVDVQDEIKKAEKQFESRYDDAQKEVANVAAEHAVIVADHCKEIDELRAVVTAVRSTLALQNEDAARAQDVITQQREEIAQLTRILAAMRATNPLKKRGT